MKAAEVSRAGKRGTAPPPDNGGLFAWTVFILLLCGVAVACWIGTFYVFSHPEQGFSYRLLSKLRKLEPPKRFELTAAPAGEFLSPERLLERYGSMSQAQLNDESDSLERSFLRNYDHQTFKVPYLIGKYTVLDAYPLGESKYFHSGLAVVAQSLEVPNVYLEAIFPAEKAHLAAMQRILVTGLAIEFRRSYDLSAVIHIANLGDGRLLFTCMPLLYGPYGTTQNGAGFQLDPPKELSVKAGLPVVTRAELGDAERRLAEYRRATGGRLVRNAGATEKPGKGVSGATPPAGAASPTAIPGPALVRVARALPVNTPGPVGGAARATPAAKAPAKAGPPAEPVPAAIPPKPAGSPPSPAVVMASPAGAQPVLTTSPPPDTTGQVGAWATYRPGQMPRGRLLDVDQTSELAERGLGTELIYLRGDFSVTAARENRAVLRPRPSLAERMLGRGNARIIVEYPRGLPTPKEGDSFQRGPERPLQVIDVRRGADGQVNIYAREVTTLN